MYEGIKMSILGGYKNERKRKNKKTLDEHYSNLRVFSSNGCRNCHVLSHAQHLCVHRC